MRGVKSVTYNFIPKDVVVIKKEFVMRLDKVSLEAERKKRRISHFERERNSVTRFGKISPLWLVILGSPNFLLG